MSSEARATERERLADYFRGCSQVRLEMYEQSVKPWTQVLNGDQVTEIIKALSVPSEKDLATNAAHGIDAVARMVGYREAAKAVIGGTVSAAAVTECSYPKCRVNESCAPQCVFYTSARSSERHTDSGQQGGGGMRRWKSLHLRYTTPELIFHNLLLDQGVRLLVIGGNCEGTYEWVIEREGAVAKHSDCGYGGHDVAMRDGLIEYCGPPSNLELLLRNANNNTERLRAYIKEKLGEDIQ